MNSTVKELLEKLKKCNFKNNRCDYLLEHSEIDYLLEYVEELQQENLELDKENNKLVAKLNKNKILQNEFKEWLEIYIEDRDKTRKLHKEYSLSEEKLSSQYFILQQVLSKYKEIIGDK